MKSLFWKSVESPIIHETDLRKEYIHCMSQIDKISDQKWHFFRKMINKYDFETNHAPKNRAFYKLWEILSLYPECTKNVEKSLHLAEAPGSFVQVVKKMIPHCTTLAISKNPSTYAQVVKDYRTTPIFHPEITLFPDAYFYYCDMLCMQELLATKSLVQQIDKEFSFITADGGIDEQQMYDKKEELHYKLILTQIVTILMLQKVSGCCVVKFFETFTETTMSIMYLLISHYSSFFIIKPTTSRPTNSERYVVCIGFKGSIYDDCTLLNLLSTSNIIRSDMVLDVDITPEFRSYLRKTIKEFTLRQMEAIEIVMKRVRKDTFIDKKEFIEQKRESFLEWSKMYNYNE